MKKTTKKILMCASILLAFTMIGCNKSNEKNSTNKSNDQVTETVITSVEEVAQDSNAVIDESAIPAQAFGTYKGKNLNWDPLKMELKEDNTFVFTKTNEYSDGTSTDHDIYEGTYSYNSESGEVTFTLEKLTKKGEDKTSEMDSSGYYSYFQLPSKLTATTFEFADSGNKLKKQ